MSEPLNLISSATVLIENIWLSLWVKSASLSDPPRHWRYDHKTKEARAEDVQWVAEEVHSTESANGSHGN